MGDSTFLFLSITCRRPVTGESWVTNVGGKIGAEKDHMRKLTANQMIHESFRLNHFKTFMMHICIFFVAAAMFLQSQTEKDDSSWLHSDQCVVEHPACLEERLPRQQKRGGVCTRRPLCDWSRESGEVPFHLFMS